MVNHGTGWARMEYLVPARGTDRPSATEFPDRGPAGRGSCTTSFERWGGPWHGRRCEPGRGGSLVGGIAEARPTGCSAIAALQERGSLFVAPRDELYEGHDRRRELAGRKISTSNAAKEKKLTNMRSSTADEFGAADSRRDRCRLRQALEFIRDERSASKVTPKSIRPAEGRALRPKKRQSAGPVKAKRREAGRGHRPNAGPGQWIEGGPPAFFLAFFLLALFPSASSAGAFFASCFGFFCWPFTGPPLVGLLSSIQSRTGAFFLQSTPLDA